MATKSDKKTDSEDVAILEALSRLESDTFSKEAKSSRDSGLQSSDGSSVSRDGDSIEILTASEDSSGRRVSIWKSVIASVIITLLAVCLLAGAGGLWLKSEFEKAGMGSVVDQWLLKQGYGTSQDSDDPGIGELEALAFRDELRRLGDQAVVEAERSSIVKLNEYTKKPHNEDVRLFANAQILRIRAFYGTSSRIKGELFPDSVIEAFDVSSEEELSDKALASLLIDMRTDWEHRARSAWMLGGRGTNEAMTALVQAIRQDDHLEVIREATYSFQENSGYRGELFDFGAFEAYIASQKE